ncbi:hypothetical protein AA106555_1979 [Neokomagataea thailandica NBRC 106555]|uniref:Uncharacterized protein n=2 Tax=Neokomagataea TaxID=1223423 RepID=A0A4Y6V6A5_9PROT|nr:MULTISPECIES: hypothetical protein [Neokomagataea]QDH25682.1 hypothetical protein D5366_11195 [Neokomagataea tanensis]GBR55277.1 hypothetical protein AA106555_1979 [Neokomagataea thailandica NBRC 106555]
MDWAFSCRKGLTLAAILVFGPASLSGCSDLQTRYQSISTSPNAPLYTYLIIHGMARGALMSGQIQPKDLTDLIALDHKAQSAVMRALQTHIQKHDMKPGQADTDADTALSAFLAYVSR